jgi:hypothetical protein
MLVMALPTQSGGRRLSEVARHLVMPSGIETTAWPVVARQLARMRYPLDVWQQGLCTAVLGKRADGKFACSIGGMVLSIPRQTGKTYTIAGLVFALCIAYPGTLVLWSAHRVKTHNETFRSMQTLANNPAVAPFIKRVLTGAGTEAVEFNNGSRILFGARENGFGRGFAQVDVLVLDEAQILTEKAMEDMVPATNAAPNGLVLMMGTPPRPGDPGEVFTNRRDSALSGEDADTLFVELSADEDADPDDRAQWRKANPSFPHRSSETAILRMRKLLGSVESFKREGLGIWDKAAADSHAFDMDDWLSRVGSAPSDGTRVFGVKFDADGSRVSLGACLRPVEGDCFVEAVASRPMSEGTEWLVDFLIDRKDSTAQIVIDGRSGVGFLVEALRTAGFGKRVLLTPTTNEVVTAHTMFEQGVSQGGLAHSGQAELGAQIRDTTRRPIGTSGGFGWQALSDEGSVGLVDAVTLAFWGARTTKRKPGRKQVIL